MTTASETHPSHVLLLCGSLRRPSYSHGLCRNIAGSLHQRGVSPHIFDLRGSPLPLADAAWHRNPASHPDERVKTLVGLADAATAVVLVTPIYHNGPSGVLKNVLDLLAIPQFAYKPVGLASHGGARTTQAVEQMRIWTRGLLGYAITTQLCTADSDFDPPIGSNDPIVTAPPMLERIERFTQELQVMSHVMGIARPALP